MELKGNLTDFGLGSIIQANFQSKETSILWLCQQGREGIIYFDRGQIAHAKLDESDGQEALYFLSLWENGTWRLMLQDSLPSHHGSSLLSYPLLPTGNGETESVNDFMRLINRPKKAVTLKGQQADTELEQELITMISQMESVKDVMSRWQNRYRPAMIAEALTGIVNEMAIFGEEIFDNYQSFLGKAIAMAADVHTDAAFLRVRENQLVSLAALYRKLPKKNRSQKMHTIIESIVDVLESYFSQIIARFNGTDLAEQWEATSKLILGELRETALKIRY